MEIRIKSPTKQVVYPDIDDNLSLAADEKFGVEIRKPSSQRVAGSVIRTELDEGGQARSVYDSNEFTKAWINRLVNPPQLVIDGRRRSMNVQDLFRFDELAPVLKAVNERISELQTDEDDSGNS
jgi:hypothetical protein